jgi:regulator of sirC expression with transglutaminase-like and TPR domain
VNPNSHPASLEALAALPDNEWPLAAGALLIAADECPGLDIAAYLRRFDTLAAGAAEFMPRTGGPRGQLEALADYLFRHRHFTGNSANYYDPRNSYLNEVLDRRTGIPITLSVVTIEVAARLGIPLLGVGMPGHFLVRHGAAGTDLFMDPFHGGRVVTQADCHDIFQQLFGGRLAFSPEHLRPVGTRQTLLRMLSNLKSIFVQLQDVDRTARVLDRVILLNPGAVDEFRERGMMHLVASRLQAALCDFTTYLQRRPDALDRTEIHRYIDLIMARHRQLN